MFSDVLDGKGGGGARVYAEEEEIPSSPRRTPSPPLFRFVQTKWGRGPENYVHVRRFPANQIV